MALSRIKVWGNEILTATDLNAEFNNIINNASSLISPLSGSLDWDGYAHTLDAAGVTTVQSTSAIGWTLTPGSKSGTPSTTGGISNWATSTWTDSATAGSGTATAWVGHAFKRSTLAASNASVTTTDAATTYIDNAPAAGTNETLTNAWSLWVDAGAVRFDGDLHVQADLVGSLNKYSLSASVGSNALTIALKDRDGADASASTPLTFKFRSTTGSTGTYTLGTVSAALSTVVSSGSTLGTSNSVAHRIHVGALLSGSTVELCYWNSQVSGGVHVFNESDLISTTAEGGAGAADSAGVMYSTTARSNVPWVYLGFLESTQATAGTWATTPSKVQTFAETQLYPGTIVQTRSSSSAAVATGTTILPYDDTIPQNTEGDQYLTLTITPTSSINRLTINGIFLVASSVSSNILTAALFQDSTAGALTAVGVAAGSNAVPYTIPLWYTMLAGTISSTTFKVRIGPHNAATVTFNGTSGARQLGAVGYSSLEVEEIFV